MEQVVGFRFNPTDEELINYYLKNKILGNKRAVDEFISEINFCSYEPNFLPSLSKMISNDHVWYFFSQMEYTSAKTMLRRTTRSGFWKVTGKSLKIRDKKGHGGEIGTKRVLVYHERKASDIVKSSWVMYEYDITCLPPDQRTYVICKVMYKGEGGVAPPGGPNSSELCDPLVSDSSTVRGTDLKEKDKLPQNLPSVQGPVVDSSTVRAASFAKMYKLLQNLPTVERRGKLTSQGAL